MTDPKITITPLGAAIVEALPNHDKVRRIQRAFKRSGKCPASALFTTEEVEAWYKEHEQEGSDDRQV